MTTAVLERPIDLSGGPVDGGIPARQAVVRWAWRLFKKEWRQQLLILSLLIVAVAVTIVGTGVATNTPPVASATFGSATNLISLPGNDPTLAADIASIQAQIHPTDLIENQAIQTGSTSAIELRAQDPHGVYGSPTLALLQGQWPTTPGQVAITTQVAARYNLRIGAQWQVAGQTLSVVGTVENPNDLTDAFGLVPPGTLSAPTSVTILFDGRHLNPSLINLPKAASTEPLPPPAGGIKPAVVVLAFSTFGLIFIGLVAVAGFNVVAQRRLRSLGILGSLGASPKDIRRVMVANGAVVGLVGTAIGAVLGFAAWFAYAPSLQSSANHRIDPFHLPWWAIVTGMALAVITSILAARRPARAASRLSVLSALSGRPAPPAPVHRSAIPGTVLLGLGILLIVFAGPHGQGNTGSPLITVGGILCTIFGGLFFAPLALTFASRLMRRAPLTTRLAVRDLARYRSRSGAALGGISLAITIATIVCLAASTRYSNVLDYVGPNLPNNQLVLSIGGGPGAVGPIIVKPGAPPLPTPTLAQVQAVVSDIAQSLGTTDVVELDNVPVILQQDVHHGAGFNGQIYVATPAVLEHYGINPNSIAPGTDLITSRAGLNGVPHLELINMNSAFNAAPPSCHDGSCTPPAPAPGSLLKNPTIQYVSQLPKDTSDPNVLITESGLAKLGLTGSATPLAWVIQSARPITTFQRDSADQLAVGIGAAVEGKNSDPSLSELNNYATAAGILVALGVLAMTVGLIRSESARDLRTLTATGATRRTRRALTSATAATMGLLGGLLGATIGIVGSVAFYHSKLTDLANHIPYVNLALLIFGLPLLAAVGGWIFAGREPKTFARMPLD